MTSQTRAPKDLAVVVAAEIRQRAKVDCSEKTLIMLFESMYYASLRTEESHPVTLSLAYVDPTNPDPNPPAQEHQDRWRFVPFAAPISLNVPNIVKLFVASDPRSSSFAVFAEEEELMVYGLIDQQNRNHDYVNYNNESGPQRPGYFQASVLGIGHLQVTFGYEIVAELRIDTLVSRRPDVLRQGPVLQKLEVGINSFVKRSLDDIELFGAEDRNVWSNILSEQWITALCRLLLRIQNYRHGGAVLITPDAAFQNLDIKYEIKYRRLREALNSKAFGRIAKSMADDEFVNDYVDTDANEMPVELHTFLNTAERKGREAQSELDGSLWFISLLSRVDGLILMDFDLEVHGFGVEIKLDKDLGEVHLADNAAASESISTFPQRYGMRHRSMMRYCSVVHDAIGFVISQDGFVRAITFVDGRLVMWENIRLQLETKGRRRRRGRRRRLAGGTPRDESERP